MFVYFYWDPWHQLPNKELSSSTLTHSLFERHSQSQNGYPIGLLASLYRYPTTATTFPLNKKENKNKEWLTGTSSLVFAMTPFFAPKVWVRLCSPLLPNCHQCLKSTHLLLRLLTNALQPYLPVTPPHFPHHPHCSKIDPEGNVSGSSNCKMVDCFPKSNSLFLWCCALCVCSSVHRCNASEDASYFRSALVTRIHIVAVSSASKFHTPNPTPIWLFKAFQVTFSLKIKFQFLLFPN